MGRRKPELWWVWDTSQTERRLTRSPDGWKRRESFDVFSPRSFDLAEYLDRDAENENYHQLNGTHGWLAKVIREYGGEEVAAKVLRELLERGGLHGG